MDSNVPEYGFLRLKQIIGNADARIDPIIPVSAATWWAGCASGRYPKPIKHGGITLWRASDIRDLCDRIASDKGAQL